MKYLFLKLALIFCPTFILPLTLVHAGGRITGIVLNEESSEPVTFATIRLGNSDEAWITDINGRFEGIVPDTVFFLTVTCIGFEPLTLNLTDSNKACTIRLQPSKDLLEAVIITPPYDKIRYVINQAIAHRNENSPENNEWFRCNVYHKIWADYVTESRNSDTVPDENSFIHGLDSFMEKSHLLLMETITHRTFHAPRQLQDEVIASRISGWKEAPFAGLITDILPFDAYHDFFTLNGKDYFNPISKGWGGRHHFYLVDEVLQGTDTTFILSYKPKAGKEQEAMEGRVYIHSPNYAITHFTGKVVDKKLKRTITVEQQYQWTQGRWFPFRLNFEIAWKGLFKNEKDTAGLVMQGRSQIDSVDFSPPADFCFDRSKTVKIHPGAIALPDSIWSGIRPIALNEKEVNTYQQIDSMMQESGVGKLLSLVYKIAEAKIPVGFVDMNLDRLFSYNRFEKSRWGIGFQTNEKIYERASVGGWIGYGSGDRRWKYGAFLDVCLDSFQDKMMRIGYQDELQDPGRVLVHPETDRNSLRRWLMYRADRVKEFYFDARARLGYWNVGVEGRYQNMFPQYSYRFNFQNEYLREFRVIESALNLRYAYAERRSPVFRRYTATGSDFPVLYLKLTAGRISVQPDYASRYLKLAAAFSWNKHLNRIGTEHLLIMGGTIYSDKTLPLSLYFAGRGFYSPDYPVYTSGGFMTMGPYEYYTDVFLSFFWKHDFDRRLYSTPYSALFFSVAHNFLVGKMSDRNIHQGVEFYVPQRPYEESGLLLNDLVRFNYLNVAYLNFNAGYFHQWNGGKSWQENGRFVVGISFGL